MSIWQSARMRYTIALCIPLAAIVNAPAATSVTTSFEAGNTQGWVGTGGFGGGTSVDFQDGNPAPSFRTAFPNFAIFGLIFRNNSNADFLGDYTHMPWTISVDAKTRKLGLFGPGSRSLILELRDYTNPPVGASFVSVYYDLGFLRDPGAGGSGNWEPYQVTVGNPLQLTLPPGWGGTGDEDPITLEPRLPPNRSFASVLASVDEIVFSTFKPGFFYTDNYFDVAVDNLRVAFASDSGDFDLDGDFDCVDVDSLVAQIVSNGHVPRFDLTGDGLVNGADLSQWLSTAGAYNLPSQNAYLLGDANLDGVVDGSDFGIWNANKFRPVPAWCSGDFNADGVVDGSDFGLWNSQKFTSADATRIIPEPSMPSLVVAGLAAWVAARLGTGRAVARWSACRTAARLSS